MRKVTWPLALCFVVIVAALVGLAIIAALAGPPTAEVLLGVQHALLGALVAAVASLFAKNGL